MAGYLGTGTIVVFLRIVGITDSLRERLKMSVKTSASWMAHALSARLWIPSGPGLTVLVHRGHTDQPEVIIKEPPGETQVFTGETVTLQCKTKGGEDNERSYIWYKNGQMNYEWKNPPTPTLTVEPESPLFTGESVTLKCEIQSYSNWRYQWYKGSSGTAVSQSQTHTFIIRSAADQGQYWCRGERDIRPTSSQNSSTVTLTVK
ncbi:hypothetical protein NFI96_027985, partial [Prochilodus magdalenae]